MQLYDKDLLSMQEVRELVGAAKKAQQELAEKSQEEVDRIVRSIANAGVRNARRLAQMAHEDTGFGVVEDKVIKNVFASRGVYEYIKDMKTIGELGRDEEKKLRIIAVPVGVIAGLIPSTNPTSTALAQVRNRDQGRQRHRLFAAPERTAMHSGDRQGHPSGNRRSGRQRKPGFLHLDPDHAGNRQSDETSGHRDDPRDGRQRDGARSLFVRHPGDRRRPRQTVRPIWRKDTADIPLAVKRIIDSKTFDNGTICASEQSVICDADMRPAIQAEMEKQGAYFLNSEERAKLGKFILRANGTMNPEIVGRSVQTTLLAGLDRSRCPRACSSPVKTGVGRGHPYSTKTRPS